MKTIDVEPTAQVIDQIAKRMRDCALEMERTAARMREKGDITYAAEAINTVSNSMVQCRLDLLVTRPLRELMRED